MGVEEHVLVLELRCLVSRCLDLRCFLILEVILVWVKWIWHQVWWVRTSGSAMGQNPSGSWMPGQFGPSTERSGSYVWFSAFRFESDFTVGRQLRRKSNENVASSVRGAAWPSGVACYLHGSLCKAVANKGGHIPSQTAKTLNTWCERSARAGRWRSGHDGHLINYLDGMDDILQGGRDELRGFGGRAGFTHFCENFHRLVSVCFGGLLCCFCFLFVFGCFASQPVKKTPASNSSFSLFAFRISRELTDHAPCSLGNAGKKILFLSSTWLLSVWSFTTPKCE